MMTTYHDNIDKALQRFAARHSIASHADLRFRAALIDMDGTLYDSMGHHTLAWHRMMRDIGIDTDRDRFYLYEGMTGKATINRLFREYFGRDATDGEVTEHYRRKTVYFNEMTPVMPMPGARDMLEKFRSHGVRCVLVTGSGQRSLIDRLERDFPGIFSTDMMITSADVKHGKPDPEPYIEAMRRAGVAPVEAVVIENAPLGVRAGAQSGAFTIGLTTGPVPVEALEAEGADIVLPSMMALARSTGMFVK